MKTTLWTIMLLCAINNISAQVKSQVKESFELTSIAFRLAGAEEYINNTIPGYTADIDNYFSNIENISSSLISKDKRGARNSL